MTRAAILCPSIGWEAPSISGLKGCEEERATRRWTGDERKGY